MLNFTLGNTTQRLVVTLNERKTLTNPYYLFVFQNIQTRVDYPVVINSTSDLSAYPSRFNEFQINVATVFGTVNTGDYNYSVYEQASSSNTDPTGLNLLENGKMKMRTTETAVDAYETTTTYKAYKG